MPPALIAAMPVGARTTIRLDDNLRNVLRKVVFPVPARPVKNRLCDVSSMIRHAVRMSMLGLRYSESGSPVKNAGISSDME